MQMTRRNMVMFGSALAASSTFASDAMAQFRPASRYPDPAIQALDPSFNKIKLGTAAVERIATGMRWCEGPVWFGDGGYLLWSDIPNNAILRWDERTGIVSPYRKPSNFANGNTRDRQGRLITCEHLTRRITRTEHDGSVTVLADRYDGKPFNSPNDIIVKSDDSIWFSDPPFGIGGLYEGLPAKAELLQNVYRLDPKTGDMSVVAADIKGPNGLCFSPDEKKFYLIEARATPNRLIYAYDVVEDGKALANRRVLIDCGKGTADGMRCDREGNLWCGWGMGTEDLDGVMIFNSEGKAIGRIALPERCANLCFGGAHGNRLFMASSQSIYSLFVEAQGAIGG